jgi:murein L,D-transpeptidase YafK
MRQTTTRLTANRNLRIKPTVYTSTLRQMESLNMERAAPIVIRIYKEESTLEIWKQDRTGRFVLLNTYSICKYSGKLGPKIVEGDRQAPEGFYDITLDQMTARHSCSTKTLGAILFQW